MNRPTPNDLTGLFALAVFSFLVRMFLLSDHPAEWDSANYCLGLLKYDIAEHTPHPPGYLLYIGLGRLVNAALDNPHLSLAILSNLFAAAAVFPLFLLAARLTNRTTAWWVTLLALFNPIAWYYSCFGMSSITELFFAPLVIWLLLVGWEKGALPVLLASFILGLSGGFRGNLIPFLGPVWAYAVWRAPIGWPTRFLAAFALGAGMLLWWAPTVWISGGYTAYREINSEMQTFILHRDSVLFGASVERIAANLVRLGSTLWNGTTFLCLVPLVALLRSPRRSWERIVSPEGLLIALWLAPAFAFFLLLYIDRPAYLLSVLPPLLIAAVGLLRPGGNGRRYAHALPAAALLIANLSFFALPAFESISRTDDGYLTPHKDLPASKRIARQILRLTRASLVENDRRIEATFRLIDETRKSVGKVAVILLPNSLDLLRPTMAEFPDISLYTRETRREGYLVARGFRTDPAQTDAQGDPCLAEGGQSIVWIGTYDREQMEILQSNGLKGMGRPGLVRAALSQPEQTGEPGCTETIPVADMLSRPQEN